MKMHIELNSVAEVQAFFAIIRGEPVIDDVALDKLRAANTELGREADALAAATPKQ